MKIEEVFARRRFIMLDGAMGTQLQLRGLTTEQKPELAAFIMPDVLTAVHRDYARAGADILLANTFGANPRKLKGTGYTVQQVIEASIACARIAAQETGALVALDIGPIGEVPMHGIPPRRGSCWPRPVPCRLRMPAPSLLRWCAPVPQPGQTSSFWKQ